MTPILPAAFQTGRRIQFIGELISLHMSSTRLHTCMYAIGLTQLSRVPTALTNRGAASFGRSPCTTSNCAICIISCGHSMSLTTTFAAYRRLLHSWLCKHWRNNHVQQNSMQPGDRAMQPRTGLPKRRHCMGPFDSCPLQRRLPSHSLVWSRGGHS